MNTLQSEAWRGLDSTAVITRMYLKRTDLLKSYSSPSYYWGTLYWILYNMRPNPSQGYELEGAFNRATETLMMAGPYLYFLCMQAARM